MRRVWLRMGEWLGALAWMLGIRRSVALDGLLRAFPERPEPERRAIGRDSYLQLGRSLFEVLMPPGDAELEQFVRFDGWDLIETALAGGRGAVCAVAHFGNFELLARVATRRGVKLSVVVRNLEDPFGRWLFRSRTRVGVRNLPDRGSSKDALAVLRRGETLALAVDQNMRPARGIFVDFFGHPACTTPAPAVFSLRSGAPLLTAFPVRQEDGTHLVRIRGPFTSARSGHAAVVDLTQQITRAVEEEVRARPDHWFWVHRRWKTRPE